jgi:hypothetical protein
VGSRASGVVSCACEASACDILGGVRGGASGFVAMSIIIRHIDSPSKAEIATNPTSGAAPEISRPEFLQLRQRECFNCLFHCGVISSRGPNMSERDHNVRHHASHPSLCCWTRPKRHVSPGTKRVYPEQVRAGLSVGLSFKRHLRLTLNSQTRHDVLVSHIHEHSWGTWSGQLGKNCFSGQRRRRDGLLARSERGRVRPRGGGRPRLRDTLFR